MCLAGDRTGDGVDLCGRFGHQPGAQRVRFRLEEVRIHIAADEPNVCARHDGQVKRALAAGPCAVLVLGGGHDLSASIRRLGGGTGDLRPSAPAS